MTRRVLDAAVECPGCRWSGWRRRGNAGGRPCPRCSQPVAVLPDEVLPGQLEVLELEQLLRLQQEALELAALAERRRAQLHATPRNTPQPLIPDTPAALFPMDADR